MCDVNNYAINDAASQHKRATPSLQERGMRLMGAVTLGITLPFLGGCLPRLHGKHPVEIEVFDALTLEPVAGAEITNGAPTDKFQPTLREHATTDANGRATIRSIRLVDDAWWQVCRTSAMNAPCGPYYEGVGLSQMPSEFEEIKIAGKPTRYRAPLWPTIMFSIDLPSDYRGLLVLRMVDGDVAADSGWRPPAELFPIRLEANSTLRAALKPNSDGVVTSPRSIAGVRGFLPDAPNMPHVIVNMAGKPLPWVDTTDALFRREVIEVATPDPNDDPSAKLVKLVETPIDATVVRAWNLRVFDVPGAPPSYTAAQDPWLKLWFIGSLDELREWLTARHLRGLSWRGSIADTNDPAATRAFAAHKLRPLVPTASTVGTPPVWSAR
ncbi:MAG: hypothetical protein RIR10_331 [Planctomycetota bacterium]